MAVQPNQRVKLAGPAGTMESSVCAPASARSGAQFPLRRRGGARSLRAIR